MNACGKCGTKYPSEAAYCTRHHCASCGSADLRTTHAYEESDFIVVHACLVMWIAYSCLVAWLEPAHIAIAVSVYPFVMMILWLEHHDSYVCRACASNAGEPETGIAITEHGTAPRVSMPGRRRLAAWRRRGGLSLVVSACAVTAFVLHFAA